MKVMSGQELCEINADIVKAKELKDAEVQAKTERENNKTSGKEIKKIFNCSSET